MKLVVQHYKDLLPSLGLYVGEDNIIRQGGGEMGKLADFFVGDNNNRREVYLPTDEALKDLSFKDKAAFHPLAENSLKRRSPMLTAIQTSLQTRLFTVGYLLITSLLHAAAAQKNGTLKSTAPDLLKFMVGLEDVTDDTGRFFAALAEKMGNKDPSRNLFNVYLKHGGQLKGEKYLRICSVTSPLVKALEEAQVRGAAKSGGLEVWGVTAKRKMDVGVLLRVIKTIFPLIETEGYTVGSNDKIAPYCDALFQSVQILNKDIRYATTHLAYVEPCKSAVDYLLVNDDVINEMEDYAILKNQIILTAYNDGDGFASDGQRNELVDTLAMEPHKTKNSSFSGTYVEPAAPVKSPSYEYAQHLIKPIQRIPGTRQALVEIPEEEYRTVQEERRRASNYTRTLDATPRGFNHPTQAHSNNQYGNGPRAFDLEQQLDRALERLEEMEEELRRGGRRYSSRYDDEDERYGRTGRSGRPVPRAVTEDRRNRRESDRRGGRDRFGRR